MQFLCFFLFLHWLSRSRYSELPKSQNSIFLFRFSILFAPAHIAPTNSKQAVAYYIRIRSEERVQRLMQRVQRFQSEVCNAMKETMLQCYQGNDLQGYRNVDLPKLAYFLGWRCVLCCCVVYFQFSFIFTAINLKVDRKGKIKDRELGSQI